MRAKKSLGQNFLKDSITLEKILSRVVPGVVVLEVGPGKGALTKKLLKAGHQVIAIEKDHRLIEPLQEMFTGEIASGQFRLIHGDALEDTPTNIFRNRVPKFQVVANLPYYITGLYLRGTLQSDYQPTQMILLLQEEVVDRIVAADGRESILSISVKAYGDPSKIMRVGRAKFSPAPRVDSAVLHIANISKGRLEGIDENIFFTVLKQGFASKRKTLANNLKSYSHTKELIAELNLEENIRPERVHLLDWLRICKRIIC